jgi:hypothetical protein
MNIADKTLAAKISKAVMAVDAAIVTKNELARKAGMLLHEAHERHPGRAAFEAFLKLTDGVKYSRAMDLIAVATDRKTFEKLQADAAARLKKHRDKKKALPEPSPQPKKQPRPDPAGVRCATDEEEESPEASAERRKAENAALNETSEQRSAKALAEFAAACRTYLPKLTIEADRQKARLLVSELTTSKRKAA